MDIKLAGRVRRIRVFVQPCHGFREAFPGPLVQDGIAEFLLFPSSTGKFLKPTNTSSGALLARVLIPASDHKTREKRFLPETPRQPKMPGAGGAKALRPMDGNANIIRTGILAHESALKHGGIVRLPEWTHRG